MRDNKWVRLLAYTTGMVNPTMTSIGPELFALKLLALNTDGVYEYRDWVKHPLLTLYGADTRLSTKWRYDDCYGFGS